MLFIAGILIRGKFAIMLIKPCETKVDFDFGYTHTETEYQLVSLKYCCQSMESFQNIINAAFSFNDLSIMCCCCCLETRLAR